MKRDDLHDAVFPTGETVVEVDVLPDGTTIETYVMPLDAWSPTARKLMVRLKTPEELAATKPSEIITGITTVDGKP